MICIPKRLVGISDVNKNWTPKCQDKDLTYVDKDIQEEGGRNLKSMHSKQVLLSKRDKDIKIVNQVSLNE